MKFRNLFVATISLPIMALASMPASAVNTKVYNGSYCNPESGSESAHFRREIGGIRNISSVVRAITCPVLHDEAFGPIGAKVYVFWVPGPSRGLLECTAYSLHPNGTVQTRIDGSSRGNWLPEWDGFSRPQPALVIVDDDASYNIRCSLPPGGRLTAIQVDENN